MSLLVELLEAALAAAREGDLPRVRALLVEAAPLAEPRGEAPASPWRAQVRLGLERLPRRPHRARDLFAAALAGASAEGVGPRLEVLRLLAACDDRLGRFGHAVDLWSEILRDAAVHGLHNATVEQARAGLEAFAAYPRFFVSFTRADPWAHELARALKRLRPDRVVLDEDDFVPGEPLRGRIIRAMGECSSIVLLVGPAYLRRPWTAMEVQVSGALSEVGERWAAEAEETFALASAAGLDRDAHVARLEAAVSVGIRRVIPVRLTGLAEVPFWEHLLWLDASAVDTEPEVEDMARNLLGAAASRVGAGA